MASKKISEVAEVVSLQETDVMPIGRPLDSTAYKMSVGTLLNHITTIIPEGPPGPVGAKGDIGSGITNVVDNLDGTLTLEYGGGLSVTTDSLTGPQGTQGVQGAQGTQGIQGAQGPTGSTGPPGNPGYTLVSAYASLTAAVAAIGSTVTNLLLDAPTTLTAGTTAPATLNIIGTEKGTINQGAYTLSFGSFSADRYPVFIGSGAITFLAGSCDVAYPEWFGAKADNSTDCRTPFTYLCRCGIRDISLSEGTYLFPRTANGIATSGSVVVANTVRFFGKGKGKTILAEGQTVLTYTGCLLWLNTDVSADFNDLTIQGPTVEPTTGNLAPFLYGVSFMEVTSSREVRMSNVAFTGWFTHVVEKSTGATTGGYFLLEFRNCEFNAYQCAIAGFAANDVDGHIRAFDCVFWRGQVPVGHPGYPFDHVLYIHPHVNIHFERCRFVEYAGKFMLAHFSGGGKTSASAKYARFVDCRFEGAAPVFVQSEVIPLEFERCYFSANLDNASQSTANNIGVTFRDCTMMKMGLSDQIDGGNVTVIGGVIYQSTMSMVQSYPGTWKFIGTEFKSEAAGASQFVEIRGAATKTVFQNVSFVSTLTGANKASAPLYITGSGTAEVVLSGVRATGQWGMFTNSGLLNVDSAFSGPIKITNSDLSGLTAATTPIASLDATIPAGTLTISETVLPDSKMRVVVGGNYQFVTPTRGVNPTALASAATLAITYRYDTYRVSGTTAITNILVNNDATSQIAFSGSIKLIATGAWSLANSGNIRPRVTPARTVNEVVTLTYDPVTALWYE